MNHKKLFTNDGINQFLLILIAMMIIGVGLSTSLSSTNLRSPLSPIDEGAHIDYVIQLAKGNIPHFGSLITEQTRKIADCNPGPNPPFPPATCASPVPSAKAYPAGGFSYEAQQGPLGYIPYALAWNLFHLASKSPKEEVRDLRLVNLFWIILTMLLFGLLCFIREIPGVISIALSLIFSTFNLIATSFTYVTNDSSSTAIGIASLLLFILLKKRIEKDSFSKGTVLSYVLFGCVIGLTKATDIIAPITILTYLLFQPKIIRKNNKELIKIQIAQVSVSALTFVLFQLYQFILSTSSSGVVMNALGGPNVQSHLPLSVVESSLQNIIAALNLGTGVSGLFFTFMVSGSLIASIFEIKNKQVTGNLSITQMFPAMVSTSLLTMVGMCFFWYVNYSQVFSTPPRYLLSLVPMLLLPISVVLENNYWFLRFFMLIGIMSLSSLVIF